MARENLFDGRYHYDYIYPRGRSGEALRAYDTQDDNRLVVIKRPASQDAPPIRSGQEVSIRTERRALQQLNGHPVLTELLAEGTFRVGGQNHLYIVMERATGDILEDEVLELAKTDSRLPELEMLVIIDNLLDLLQTAHKHEIVYNDVDAKHLFWNRESYQLKVIDWGNAVFLEGDDATPQGISRQSDIFQVGELLYFIITGGQRLSVVGDEVDFGPAATQISTRLQRIIQRATHPVLDHRYPDMAALRGDLTEYRLPFERDRTKGLERIAHRLQRECSQHELERLLSDVKAIQARDPGHPEVRTRRREIEAELHRLSVLADLDAVHIYLESANWSRAVALLEQVIERADKAERDRAQLLLAAVSILNDNDLQSPPAGVIPAIEAIFADNPAQAARLLLVTSEHRDEARRVQWLLAERIQVLVPQVIVLRPHLLRLHIDLAALQQRYSGLDEALHLVAEDSAALADFAATNLIAAMPIYQRVADDMTALIQGLELLQEDFSDASLTPPLQSARRAGYAAATVVEHLTQAGMQITAAPEVAIAELEAAQVLDPVNPVFAGIRQSFDGLQQALHDLAAYRPQADGADLAQWFTDAMQLLEPYTQELPDPRLGMLIGGLRDAAQHWQLFQTSTVQGDRQGAAGSLQRVADAVRRVNPELSAWLNNVRAAVENSRYVQRHALNTTFGRFMADGWTAWDRGSGIEAERLGKQALEEVNNDLEAAAADRLARLGKMLRSWQENNGEGDPALTARIDQSLLTLLTEDEDRYWNDFTDQMPSAEAYLNAMGSGLIEHFEQTSTAAQRILFFHYALRGVMEMYEGNVDDAEFWQSTAGQALPDASRHIAYLALNNVIRDRQIVVQLAAQINSIESIAAVPVVQQALDRSVLRLMLTPLADMLHHVVGMVPHWEQGAFRDVGESLEAALAALDEGEKLAHIRLNHFRAWVERLYREAAELSVTRQRIEEVVAAQVETPDARLLAWHQRLIDGTEFSLGEAHQQGFRRWRDTYQSVLAIYTDGVKRRSRKLHDFDELFNRTPGIDTHPAYELYRFWRETIEASPEFPAPPTDQPVPQYAEDEAAARQFGGGGRWRQRLRLTRTRVLLLAVLVVVFIVGGLSIASYLGQDDGSMAGIAVTWETFTPTLDEQAAAAATESAMPTAAAVVLTATNTLPPTATAPPSVTPTVTTNPTATAIPTLDSGEEVLPTMPVLIPTNTVEVVPTITPAPALTATLPPVSPDAIVADTPVAEQTANAAALGSVFEELHGQQNMIMALEQYPQAFPWPQSWFHQAELGGSWVLGVPGADVGDNILQIVLPAELLAQMFGPDAAGRLRRVEASLHLRDYEPALVEDGLVYWGMGLQGLDTGRVAVQAQLVRENAINVGARVGDEFRARTTLPVVDARVTVVLERLPDGTVILFVDDEQIGQPRFLTAPDAPVIPYLFVQQGGVIIGVTDFVVEFE
ncbi:hypothetical protein ACFLYO_03650 [Chloroflexota bacterium]